LIGERIETCLPFCTGIGAFNGNLIDLSRTVLTFANAELLAFKMLLAWVASLSYWVSPSSASRKDKSSAVPAGLSDGLLSDLPVEISLVTVFRLLRLF
jgi:hypothetical protein